MITIASTRFALLLARFTDALATQPAMPVIAPDYARLWLPGAPHCTALGYTAQTKTELGASPVFVVAQGAFKLPPQPVATFYLN